MKEWELEAPGNECLDGAGDQLACLGRTSRECMHSQHREWGYGSREWGTGHFGWESRELGKGPSTGQRNTGWVGVERALSQVPTMGRGSYRLLNEPEYTTRERFFFLKTLLICLKAELSERIQLPDPFPGGFINRED